MTGSITPIRQTRSYPLFWRWHFLAAIIVIPFVLWQSTTGTLYLWSEWWMDVQHPSLRFVAEASSPMPPSQQLAAALAAVKDAPQSAAPQGHQAHASHGEALQSSDSPRVVQLVLPDDPRRSTEVLLQSANGLPYPIFVDPYNGRILGRLTAAQWLPGLSRALHAGWPLGKPGNWLLELGNCWAIVMIVSGLYLWWPRGRGFWETMNPRRNAGLRILVRDLHAIVAVLFSGIFLFFLISALPWTSFWGGEILPRVQTILNQQSPAGFSAGGATADQMLSAATSIDSAVRNARARGVAGTLTIQLSPWQGAPLFLANRVSSLQKDRTLLASPATGQIGGDFRNRDLPVIPRMVAVGIHVHQGDFGLLNLWLNTLFAGSLVWLSGTGLVSWWIRRPKGQLGVPQSRGIVWPKGVIISIVVAGLLLPIFGLSVLAIWVAKQIFGRALRPQPI
jgi:uncharacterized iron-regulated membrane protein